MNYVKSWNIGKDGKIEYTVGKNYGFSLKGSIELMARKFYNKNDKLK